MVPPRVTSAVIRTALNGWCTARRFQIPHSRCMMGCPAEGAEDSIEHYASCRVIADTAHRWLHLGRDDSMQTRLEVFMGMNSHENLEDKARRQVLTAAAYKLHNNWRHNPKLNNKNTAEMQQALGLMIQEVVAGHSEATTVVDTAWRRQQSGARRKRRRQ